LRLVGVLSHFHYLEDARNHKPKKEEEEEEEEEVRDICHLFEFIQTKSL
jgi:hypothetical protein